MKKIKINILASDFKNNTFCNMTDGLEGCPMERGLIRAGIRWGDLDYNINLEFLKAHTRIFNAFNNPDLIEDFSFEIILK